MIIYERVYCMKIFLTHSETAHHIVHRYVVFYFVSSAEWESQNIPAHFRGHIRQAFRNLKWLVPDLNKFFKKQLEINTRVNKYWIEPSKYLYIVEFHSCHICSHFVSELAISKARFAETLYSTLLLSCQGPLRPPPSVQKLTDVSLHDLGGCSAVLQEGWVP